VFKFEVPEFIPTIYDDIAGYVDIEYDPE